MNRSDMVEVRACRVVSCREPAFRMNLCNRHHLRVRIHGTIHPATGRLNPERHLWSFVRLPSSSEGCWIWIGDLSRDGYGYAGFLRQLGFGRSKLAHRVVYELREGPIPAGLVLDHLCRMPRCVNPEHLEPVTNLENVRRGLHGELRTHCPVGHELVESNVYTPPGSTKRDCRRCKRENGKLSARRCRARLVAGMTT